MDRIQVPHFNRKLLLTVTDSSGRCRAASTPMIGESKKGDLAELLVYKFRTQGQLYLLGYTLDDQIRLIDLEAVGPYENFYRDLKRG